MWYDSVVDVEQLATLYDDVINDTQIVLCQSNLSRVAVYSHRIRSFDDARREARRRCRHAERRSTRHSEFADDACVELRSYRTLIRLKITGFWQHFVQSQRNKRRQIWQPIEKLMGRGNVQAESSLTADGFHRFFINKVAKVRDSTVVSRSRRTMHSQPAAH
jgi:hypothetical protein